MCLSAGLVPVPFVLSALTDEWFPTFLEALPGSFHSQYNLMLYAIMSSAVILL